MTQPAAITTPTVSPAAAVEKEQNLRRLMRDMRSVLVAYSGGVDSAYVAFAATRELGESALCVLGVSPSVSSNERKNAVKIAADFKFNFTTLETEEINNPDY